MWKLLPEGFSLFWWLNVHFFPFFLFFFFFYKVLCSKSFTTSTSMQKYYLLPNYLKKCGRRDMKRRALYEDHEMERSNLRVLKKNDILPSAVRQKAASDMDKLPLNSSITRVRNRCVLTDRGRGIVGKYRISRMMFRYYADKGLIAGMQKAQW